jgi:predicted DNA-binding transcriptional regulator YafY
MNSLGKAWTDQELDCVCRRIISSPLGFIEERLFWVGEVNRLDLVRRFGVSMSQASADIARYLALGPRISYDKSAKRYVAGEDFRTVLAAPDAGRLLGELPLVELGVLAPGDTLLGLVPPFSATPVPTRAVDAFVLRAVLRAIRERRTLEVLYQSMSRPAPARRRIAPHALVHDGFRWHARAYDDETQAFRDFVLGRMAKPKLGEAAELGGESDRDWQSFVALRIAPHPKLTPAQARAIALDYGMTRRAGARAQQESGQAVIRVRRALLFYALRRLGLDVPETARAPEQQHIVLVNRAEIDAARAPAPDL